MIQDKAREIIACAVAREVYDLYFQAVGSVYRIYFRGTEARKLFAEIEREEGLALLAHFKFCAGMNVGERRRVQLGACWYELGQVSRRLRLSSVGDFEGNESLVIRILHEQKKQLDFWFSADKLFEQMIFKRGLYLFAGPVGSGKTSLMFDLAAQKFAGLQVMTVEDPVEIVASDFVQLQVNEVIGNDYEELIKLSLRHRPDLLIVGEIRDKKTARAVLQASLTGYTVFSTVHARSVAGVWARLLELGLSKEELESCLQAVLYQRLIAGKGVVEYAENDFENARESSWNAKIAGLVAAGHLTSAQAEKEKIGSDQAGQVDSVDE